MVSHFDLGKLLPKNVRNMGRARFATSQPWKIDNTGAFRRIRSSKSGPNCGERRGSISHKTRKKIEAFKAAVDFCGHVSIVDAARMFFDLVRQKGIGRAVRSKTSTILGCS